jgi:hypothetical protein
VLVAGDMLIPFPDLATANPVEDYLAGPGRDASLHLE